MLGHRRFSEATRRADERRSREDDAPRLKTRVPYLESLMLQVRESREREGRTFKEAEHIRRVVVERAPALFEIPCSDRNCVGGGHDMTAEVLRALDDRLPLFDGESSCRGMVGELPCARMLSYTARATYR